MPGQPACGKGFTLQQIAELSKRKDHSDFIGGLAIEKDRSFDRGVRLAQIGIGVDIGEKGGARSNRPTDQACPVAKQRRIRRQRRYGQHRIAVWS